jgi:SAM-dependent methyltransferase
MFGTTPKFDAAQYKETTREQWQAAAEAWHRWGPRIERWLGPATELLLDMARVKEGSSVLDVAAGAGGQSLAAARRVGSTGHVVATDISPNILAFTRQEARRVGLTNIETRVLDAENLEVPFESFDAVISRLGLIHFPDQQKALRGMRWALKPGGRVTAIVYSTAEKNGFVSVPFSVIARRTNLPQPLPGHPGPFSLGGAGVLHAAFEQAGFRDIVICSVAAPLHMNSAEECLRFEKESFGALHQMMASLDETERKAAWGEIERELHQYYGPNGFEAPCDLIVGAAASPKGRAEPSSVYPG